MARIGFSFLARRAKNAVENLPNSESELIRIPTHPGLLAFASPALGVFDCLQYGKAHHD
jgi:hypothetical protein